MDALQASIVLGDSLRFVSQRDYYIFLLRGGKRALILSHVISLVISRMQYTVKCGREENKPAIGLLELNHLYYGPKSTYLIHG